MCLRDVIKKHFWRIAAIFFLVTTIGLGIGWLLDSRNCNPTDPLTTSQFMLPEQEQIEKELVEINPKFAALK